MSKNDPKFRRFVNLEGYLQKKSSNLLIGFQIKYWKILDNGTKIGYSNQKNQPIKAQNVFLIKQCLASESSGNNIFQLETRDRVFILKAPNEQQRTDWIKGLTFLKKLANNQIKLKAYPTQTTMASRAEKTKLKKNQKTQPHELIKVQKPKIYQPQDLNSDLDTLSQIVKQLSKYLPQKCLKYYTLITQLKMKSQGLFTDKYNTDTYLMISPKSLYPDIYIGDQNLTNVSLPPWLEINVFYRIFDLNTSNLNKEKKKEIFNINKIIDVQEGSQKSSIKINIGEVIHQFFTDTVQQKQCLKSCLQIASVNAQQVMIKSKISKKNYDKLIDLHETNLQLFQKQSKKIVASYMKNPQQPLYDPPSLFHFMDGSMSFLNEFIQILEHKKKNKDHVVLDMLKQFHQQVKIQAKLTWDCSYFNIKAVDVLNMLKKLSQYYQMMKNFIKSSQFLQGMKQLSKIYVRQSWKNFQSIIISIVQQEKKSNFLQDQYCEYLQTHGVTDLFKFIYNVFQLSAHHWKNKIHLHNVNRLMQRALQVFVNQMRSTIDEQVIPERQLIGIANNYFCFSDHVKQFYTQKFEQQLAQKTQQSYQKIISSYKQVSMIILQKIASSVGEQIQAYTQKNTIQTIRCEKIDQILYQATHHYQKMLHMAFQRKMFDKIARQLHIRICYAISQLQKNKKKPKLKQICKFIKDLRTGFNKIFDNLCKNHTQIDKKMHQLDMILTYELYSDLQTIIASNPQPLKGTYLKILSLREDYYEGSALYRIINESEQASTKNQRKKSDNKRKGSFMIDGIRQKDQTLSKQYFQQQLMDSDENQKDDEKSQTHSKKNRKSAPNQNKIISEGYLVKGKRNQKVWQKSYFRLKNGHLYIFQSADSQKCNNSIDVKNIISVNVTNIEKPSFLLTYKTLAKQKQLKLKAQSIQLRQRWVNSIQLQKKRLMNEQQVKKKNIKYRETQTNGGKKKNQMIIDYQEVQKGRDYFSYSN